MSAHLPLSDADSLYEGRLPWLGKKTSRRS